MDLDNSGNFDPSEEAKQKSVRLQRAKALKAAKKKCKGRGKGSGKENGKGKKERYTAKEPCECGDGKLLLRLKIENTAQLRVNTDDQSSCPEGYKPPCEECEAVQNRYRKIYQIPIKDPARDPARTIPDLTGYPEARGCKTCRYDGTEEGKPCTMIHGGGWPCDRCDEKGVVCQPIMPFDEQGRCKSCHEKNRDDCSFETDPGQAICDNCFDDELECEPLPPVGYKMARISMDEILYGPNRPATRCAKCFINGKRCNLKAKTDKPPCKQCKKAGTGCIFIEEKTLKPLKEKKAANKNAPIFTNGQFYVPEVSVPSADLFTAGELAEFEESSDEEIERTTTPEIEMEDDNGNKGMTTKIMTSFAHPITFHSLFDETPAAMCSFCEIPFFPFVGHCEREVFVFRWYSGLGYSEIGGGHCEAQGPTTMCRDCVVERAQMLNCEEHETVAIALPDPMPTFDDLTANMCELGGDREAARAEMKKWCSFCITPAVHVCCKLQPALLEAGSEGKEGEQEILGCGLRLCRSCESAFRGTYGGNVSEMAAELNKVSKAVEGEDELAAKVRADVGFLAEEGLLMRNVIHKIEQE